MENNNIPMSFGVCSQCGLAHPPIIGPCPMAQAKVENKSNDTPDYFYRIETFLNNMRVSFKMNIESKNIKDYDKFFIYISGEVKKIINNYKE